MDNRSEESINDENDHERNIDAAIDDIFKKIQHLPPGAMNLHKRLKGILKLDSEEKERLGKFYGHQFEWKRQTHGKEKKLKRVEEEYDVQQLIDTLVEKPRHDNLISSETLRRIQEYGTEFKNKALRRYVPKAIDTSKNHIKGISWNNEHITEMFSESVNKNINEWAGVGNFLPKEPLCTTKPDTGFGMASRFPKPEAFSPPPPGTYGNTANLHIPEKRLKKPTSLLPTFEWSSGRRKDHLADNKLPPNAHSPKFVTVAGIVDRTMSKRGPYDTFTGPRDASTIKNHFGPGFQAQLKWWPMVMPGIFDKPNRYGYGDFSKSKPYHAEKKVSRWPSPEPASYQNSWSQLKTFKPNKYPFNNGEKFIWSGPMKCLPVPGPGRYNIHSSKKQTHKKSKRPLPGLTTPKPKVQ